jgi:hypothetical protein
MSLAGIVPGMVPPLCGEAEPRPFGAGVCEWLLTAVPASDDGRAEGVGEADIVCAGGCKEVIGDVTGLGSTIVLWPLEGPWLRLEDAAKLEGCRGGPAGWPRTVECCCCPSCTPKPIAGDVA